MRVVRSAVGLVPVGPLLLTAGVVVAIVVSITDIKAGARLPDATIGVIDALELLAVWQIDPATTGPVLLHIWGIGRFIPLDLPLRPPLSRVLFDFVTPTGLDRISGELSIQRGGPLERVKSVLYLFNHVLRDGTGFLEMGIFECFGDAIFPRYSMNILESRILLLSADHITDHHGCAN